MKTFALALVAVFALPLAAHAGKKPVSSAKPRDMKVSSAKPRDMKVSSARPRDFGKKKRVSSAKPKVLNYDLSGNPFYSDHRVLSLQ